MAVTAGAAALWSAAAIAAPPAPDAAEKAVADDMRPIYERVLARAGSTVKRGSPDFEIYLARTASAFLAARPDDCDLESWLSRNCDARSFDVPASSMEPSIHRGDYILTLPVTDARPIQRGDVIVFRVQHPGDAEVNWVARVVGLPGDRVGLKAGVLAIGGVGVGRVAAGTGTTEGGLGPESRWIETLPGGRSHAVLGDDDRPITHEMDEVTVPPGHFYVMGDNRQHALDSRYAASGDGSGLPAVSDVIGRVKLVYVSRDLSQIGRSP